MLAADELDLVANELDKAATELVNKATGKSRELRAWATRLRRQATIIRDENDLGDDQRSSLALKESVRVGLTFSERALITLAAVVQTLAGAPGAIEVIDTTLPEAIAAIESSVERIVEAGDGLFSDSDPAESSMLEEGPVPPQTVEASAANTEDNLFTWMKACKALPKRHVDETFEGQAELMVRGTASPLVVSEYPNSLTPGDTTKLWASSPSESLETFFHLYATGETGIAMVTAIGDQHKQLFDVRLRCLGFTVEYATDVPVWDDDPKRGSTYEPVFLVEIAEPIISTSG